MKGSCLRLAHGRTWCICNSILIENLGSWPGLAHNIFFWIFKQIRIGNERKSAWAGSEDNLIFDWILIGNKRKSAWAGSKLNFVQLQLHYNWKWKEIGSLQANQPGSQKAIQPASLLFKNNECPCHFSVFLQKHRKR